MKVTGTIKGSIEMETMKLLSSELNGSGWYTMLARF